MSGTVSPGSRFASTAALLAWSATATAIPITAMSAGIETRLFVTGPIFSHRYPG